MNDPTSLPVRLVACAWLIFALACQPIAAEAQSGRFEGGSPSVDFDDDGRTMILRRPMAFVDPNGRRWEAPTGTRTDGASIPKAFWSIIGGPFEGKYRGAAIIHDRYCDTRTRKWEDTHQAFYQAMIAAGTEAKKAWLMYKAVERFGPRWPAPTPNPQCLNAKGEIDYGKCAENNAFEETQRTFPSATKDEIAAFLDEVKAQADSSDIEKVRADLNKK